MRSGGSRHMKWKERGQPSQQRKRPMPRQDEQKSWLTKSTSALPLPFRGRGLVVFCTREPTRRPRPEAETPARTWVSPPRVGLASGFDTPTRFSRSVRPADGPTIVCTSAATSCATGAAKTLSALPCGTVAERGAGVLRDDGALDSSRESPVAVGDETRPRRGRVAAMVFPGLVLESKRCINTHSARRFLLPPPDAAVDAGEASRSRPGVPIAGMRRMNEPLGFSTGTAAGVLGAELSSSGVPRVWIMGGCAFRWSSCGVLDIARGCGCGCNRGSAAPTSSTSQPRWVERWWQSVWVRSGGPLGLVASRRESMRGRGALWDESGCAVSVYLVLCWATTSQPALWRQNTA